MKILMHSNAPHVGTGYGKQTAQLARRLRDAGHDIAVSAFYGLQGSVMDWEGIPVYPQGVRPYGDDVITAHAEDHFGGDLQAGLILTLVDAWVLPADMLAECNCAMWAPVDHHPIPPRVIKALTESKCWPVAMSKHGQQQMLATGLDAVYAPHGIDTKLLEPKDQTLARERTGVPKDVFCVGMVAANKGAPSRKGFCEAFQAFAAFHKRHPEAVLYLHTEVTGAVEGVNLLNLALACDIPPSAVRTMHQYRGFVLGAPDEHMPYLYSSFDVLLNPSHGEGFGVPIVEAQACGVPVIVTDTTSMSELVGPGWKVPGQKWWTPQESWATVPSVPKLTAALEAAFKKARRPEVKQAARDFALGYDADVVFEQYWVPILAEFDRRIGSDGPVVQTMGGELPEVVVETMGQAA